MIIVADSSPLIHFAVLNRMELLNRVFENLKVPEAVFREVTVFDKPHSQVIQEYLKDRVVPVKNLNAVRILQNEIGPGEAEAIGLALEMCLTHILMDDHRGRKAAQANGLQPIGTIGVLLEAKKCGYLDSVRLCLDILTDKGMRISAPLYAKALQLSGE
jgi:predicted nucleic acid-binding protein